MVWPWSSSLVWDIGQGGLGDVVSGVEGKLSHSSATFEC